MGSLKKGPSKNSFGRVHRSHDCEWTKAGSASSSRWSLVSGTPFAAVTVVKVPHSWSWQTGDAKAMTGVAPEFGVFGIEDEPLVKKVNR